MSAIGEIKRFLAIAVCLRYTFGVSRGVESGVVIGMWQVVVISMMIPHVHSILLYLYKHILDYISLGSRSESCDSKEVILLALCHMRLVGEI